MQRMASPGPAARYEAPIYARVNGYLKDWHFDYGAHVKKGDVLAEIETSDLDRNRRRRRPSSTGRWRW